MDKVTDPISHTLWKVGEMSSAGGASKGENWQLIWLCKETAFIFHGICNLPSQNSLFITLNWKQMQKIRDNGSVYVFIALLLQLTCWHKSHYLMTFGSKKTNIVWGRGTLPIFAAAIKTNNSLVLCKQSDHFFGNLNQLISSPCSRLHLDARG